MARHTFESEPPSPKLSTASPTLAWAFKKISMMEMTFCYSESTEPSANNTLNEGWDSLAQ